MKNLFPPLEEGFLNGYTLQCYRVAAFFFSCKFCSIPWSPDPFPFILLPLVTELNLLKKSFLHTYWQKDKMKSG